MNPITSPLLVTFWMWAGALVQAEATDRLTFSFGTAHPAPSFTQVAPMTAYSSATGFGFEPGASATAYERFVTSESRFSFQCNWRRGVTRS